MTRILLCFLIVFSSFVMFDVSSVFAQEDVPYITEEELAWHIAAKQKEREQEVQEESSIPYTTNCPNPSSEDWEEIKETIVCVFGEGSTLASAVSFAENQPHQCDLIGGPNLNPKYRWDLGLFQINQVHWTTAGEGDFEEGRRRLKDCKFNIEFAYQLSQQGTNWWPWSTFKQGTYQPFWGK